MDFDRYRRQLQAKIKLGVATEHTHRPALEALLESLGKGTAAVNEPRRVACGAPDLLVLQGSAPLGYVETKDIGVSLDAEENSDQLLRYRGTLPNLVLTNYLEFRWYVAGDLRVTEKFATVTRDGSLRSSDEAAQKCEALLRGFTTLALPTVRDSKELAVRMAGIARLIRIAIERAFADEDKGATLHTQLESFRQVLVADLEPPQFADMYAQTIAYGLFAARSNFHGAPFRRESAAFALPKTNRFLRQLFTHIAGPELDERVTWAVDDLALLLDRTDITAVLRNFGRGTTSHDPVLHFYETFLASYDPSLRERRGVYYTPEPVVAYIVRSIAHLLRTRFRMPDGLATADKLSVRGLDGKAREYHKLLILDPAVGTGTFLHAVIREIYKHFEHSRGMWESYVSAHLLPRVIGFELLMAPYAVAHMKLALELLELGYDFSGTDRLQVFLTNSLEGAHEFTGLPLFAQWIAEEGNAAAVIKSEAPLMVILGNPPYSGISANMSSEIAGSIEPYKYVDGRHFAERKHWLHDDYVKFIRFGQTRIDRTGYGILAFITNHAYLDNPTFRGMRQSLLQSFDAIYVLNLHGSAMRDIRPPVSVRDENVFDIKQGVAISIFIKTKGKSQKCEVQYADLWGPLDPEPEPPPPHPSVVSAKYQWLREHDVSSTDWRALHPNSPNYFLVPKDESHRDEYERFFSIDEFMPINSTAVQTSRDAFVVDFDKRALLARISRLGDSSIPDDEFRLDYKLRDGRNWKLATARELIRREGAQDANVRRILYRPFDERYVYFVDELINWPRHQVMDQMIGKNVALLVPRHLSGDRFSHVLCTRGLSEMCVVSTATKEQNYHFPLWLPSGAAPKLDLQSYEMPDGSRRMVNFTRSFISGWQELSGVRIVPDNGMKADDAIGPEDLFSYIYAILHAPSYRRRYLEFLKSSFPRIPLTTDRELIRNLIALGGELALLHLFEEQRASLTRFPEPGDNSVKYLDVKTDEDESIRVHINEQQHFEGIPQRAWTFRLGSYQVCEKWLQLRKGRQLSYDELKSFEQIVAVVDRTCELMVAIDDEIVRAGGWPLP